MDGQQRAASDPLAVLHILVPTLRKLPNKAHQILYLIFAYYTDEQGTKVLKLEGQSGDVETTHILWQSKWVDDLK